MTTRRHHGWVSTPYQALIEEYLADLAASARPSTVQGYRSVLLRADAELPDGLPAATTAELRDWIWQPRWAPKTRAMYRSAVISFFRWAMLGEWVDYDPTARLPRAPQPAKLPRPCTHHQLAQILRRTRPPVRTWALLAAYAGCRCCEIADMDRDDITPEVIYIRGKGGRERIVPCHQDVWQAVADLPAGPVAEGRNRNRVSGLARSTFARAGVRTSLHRLRDWYATYGYAASRDLRAVQQLMGHSNPRTTASYIRVADASLRAAVSGLPRFD